MVGSIWLLEYFPDSIFVGTFSDNFPFFLKFLNNAGNGSSRFFKAESQFIKGDFGVIDDKFYSVIYSVIYSVNR